MLTTRVRLLLVVPVFLAVFYYLFFQGMAGGDSEGLISFLLAGAGLFVVVQATWLRGRFTPTAVLAWNPAMLALLGLGFGAVSRGEEMVGLAMGAAVGVLTALVVLWLGSLVQLRRRPRIFLSYRRSDSAAATAAVYAALSERYHARNVFMDVHTIHPGRDFRREIARVIARCDAAFVIIGRSWTRVTDEFGRLRLEAPDDPVRLEVETALGAALDVVPVLVDGAALPGPVELPDTLRELTYRHAVAVTDAHSVRTELIPRFEAAFHPYTTDSVRPPPRTRRWRRIVVTAIVVALLFPFGLRLAKEVAGDVGRLDHVAASADGRRVAALVRGGLWASSALHVWNATTGVTEATYEYPAGEAPADRLVWSPDGRFLAVGGDDGSVVVRAAADLAEVRRLPGFQGTFRVNELTWSPDGALLAAVDDAGALRVWDADSGRLVGSQPLFITGTETIAWSPTSDALAVACLYYDGAIVVDLSRQGLGAVHEFPHKSAATALSWSPDGQRLAVTFYEAPRLVTIRRDADPATARVFAGQTAYAVDVAWSPDGRRIVTSGGDIARLFDAGSGELVDQFLTRDTYEPNVVWSPSSGSIASSDETHVLTYALDGGTPAQSWASAQEFWGSQIVGWTDGGRVISQGGGDHVVRVWEPGRATPVWEWEISPWAVLVG
ncbi:TIR domain-containing protein [Pseudonocardia sp. NPDC049154]|uniref:TIR domain-containing protein n=1 Tax=Pseudonocardia sp. NPDC049154 TaxID=3155501 RepID=UPI0033D45749